ncbi:hypothetical protein [Paenibacillus pabuli]|uniref:hypothetical protein n=1 Tax=Paenibacillus pabuli TaxID=1472 RepID=UPI000A99D51E|nr:hypothetical protein [Paenibacillus pabuli]MEC0126497.1 hypothetical protein [Paenibacillus pabuli]
MDDVKIKAYKTLLYQALLDIRVISGHLAWGSEELPESVINVVQAGKELFERIINEENK